MRALFLWENEMTALPASVRHRNPGAVYPGPSAKLFGGSTHALFF